VDSFEGEVKSKRSDIHNKQHDNGAANNSSNNNNSNSIDNDHEKNNGIGLGLHNDNDMSTLNDNGIGSESDAQLQVSPDCHDNWKAAAADEKKRMWLIFEETSISSVPAGIH